MKKVIVLICAFLILKSSPILAWGSVGHKIVASLAKNYLDKGVADSVEFYLGRTSFEDAAVWMDEVRSDHAYDYMKPMHYVNVEKDKTYVKNNDVNIINELHIVMKTLYYDRKQKSKDEIKTNIMMLFHLVGDIHMPLHAGYSDDKGGNAIDVDFLGHRSNLHKVWDTNIIEEQNINVASCEAVIKTLSEKEKKAIQNSNATDWMTDSRTLLPAVYDFKDNTIDKDYVIKNTPVIEKQLSKAGLRLAGVLNQIFAANAAKPEPAK